MFQYTIWWTTRAFDCCWFDYVTSEPASATLLRAARQLQSPTNYVARLPVTYYVTRLQPTTSYYDVVICPSTTNYYYAENQSTTSLLLRLTTCRVHKLLLCGVPPVHFVCLQTMMIYLQLTYQRSLLLQLYRTVNWHCVSLLLFPFRWWCWTFMSS